MIKNTVSILTVATLVLASCGTDSDSVAVTGSNSMPAGQPTSSIALAVTPTTVEQVPDTTTPVSTTTTTTTTNAAPKTPGTTAAPKTPTSTQVPPMQLVGTPQEQFNQVKAALEKVASLIFTDSAAWNQGLHKLRASLAPHDIRATYDNDAVGTYRISMGGQSTCFLYDLVDSFAKEESLFQIACP